jgi:hypothetical protein
MPDKESISKRHLQLFLKRLRKHYNVQGIKYLASGEYGGKLDRPHYHLVIFGLPLSDLVYYKKSGHNHLFISRQIEKI